MVARVNDQRGSRPRGPLSYLLLDTTAKDMTTLEVGSSIIAIIASIVIVAIVVVLVIYQRYVYSKVRTNFIRSIQQHNDDDVYIVGFFHPRCSSGGGGERVLWKAVQAIGELKEGKYHTTCSNTSTTHGPIYSNDKLTNCKNVCVVIYTIDEPTSNYTQSTIQNVQRQFGITLPSILQVHFVHLHTHKHLLFTKPNTRFTMMVESWNTILLAYYALHQVTPHVYIDTTGVAFTFLIAKILCNCKVGAYVHYPTISTDMLHMIYDRRPSYNNNGYISTSAALSFVKLIYYCVFAVAYGLVGSLCDLTMVNSSWTKGHIEQLWKLRSICGSSSSSKIHVIYPPVDTQSVVVAQQQEHNNSSTMTNNNNIERENIILSIGQFRPEKNHALQLHSFATFLTMYKKDKMDNDDDDIIQLVLIGSCRDDDDTHRVTQLRHLAKEINIEKHVKFVINQPYSVIIDYLHKSSVGLHTMWNEHFGIGIVEMMAAGLVTIAHNSGGPKMDIILDPWDYTKTTYQKSDRFPTGCLASTVDEYATCMYEIFSRINNKKMKEEEDNNIISRIRDEGRRSVTRFSDEEFMNTFKETMLSSILFESGSYTTTMTTYVLLVTVFVVLIAILLISLT